MLKRIDFFYLFIVNLRYFVLVRLGKFDLNCFSQKDNATMCKSRETRVQRGLEKRKDWTAYYTYLENHDKSYR